jgi:hypothetical protein
VRTSAGKRFGQHSAPLGAPLDRRRLLLRMSTAPSCWRRRRLARVVAVVLAQDARPCGDARLARNSIVISLRTQFKRWRLRKARRWSPRRSWMVTSRSSRCLRSRGQCVCGKSRLMARRLRRRHLTMSAMPAATFGCNSVAALLSRRSLRRSDMRFLRAVKRTQIDVIAAPSRPCRTRPARRRAGRRPGRRRPGAGRRAARGPLRPAGRSARRGRSCGA